MDISTHYEKLSNEEVCDLYLLALSTPDFKPRSPLPLLITEWNSITLMLDLHILLS